MKHFLTLADFTQDDWGEVFARAAEFKKSRLHATLKGMPVALVMEKASTRTRVSFEVGVFELGGHAVVLTTDGSQLGRGEPIEDTARVLSGYCGMIIMRTFGQDRLATLAKWSSVPVVNALTNEHHPCQVATDLFTVVEKFGRLEGLRYAWIGDGNNMANSWIEAAGLFGLELAIACPDGYAPDPALVTFARSNQQKLGRGSITLTTDPKQAARGADVINTDVWASMGQESEAAKRRTAFAGYCVDGGLLKSAAANAIVLHCLPAHRGEEITGDVLDGPQSLAWVQAENRLHVGKAVIEKVARYRHS
ncbi:MAG: ornithine carbamoyltransferase [Kofleriaceae bacterium]